MHKSYFSTITKGAISEYKVVFHCQMYDYEESPDEIADAPLNKPFFTRRMNFLRRPDSFMLHGKLGDDFFLHFWNVISKYENWVPTNQSQT